MQTSRAIPINASLLLIGFGLISAIVHVFGPSSAATHVGAVSTAELDTISAFERAEYYFQPDVYDITKARQYYIQAIEEDPRGESLQWYQLSRIHFIQGEFDAALFALAKQEEYFGDEIHNVHYMKGLVHAFRAERYNAPRDWRQAEESFSTFLVFVPDSPWARIDLAWVYFAQDNFTEMFAVLEPVKEFERDNPWWLNMYGLAYLNTDQPEEALHWFREADRYASDLAVEDWAHVYPENDPADWPQGLREFQAAVRDNVAIAADAAQAGGGN